MESKRETVEEFLNRGGQIKKLDGERRYTEDQIQQMIERKQMNEFYGMPEKTFYVSSFAFKRGWKPKNK